MDERTRQILIDSVEISNRMIEQQREETIQRQWRESLQRKKVTPMAVMHDKDDMPLFQSVAIQVVTDYIEKLLDKSAGVEQPAYEVYVVWFAKALGNWKAMVSSTLPDGMYYEVTYNGEKSELYLDAYKKVQNVVIKD